MQRCSWGQRRQILPPPTLCLSLWHSPSVSVVGLPWMLRSLCGVRWGFDHATWLKSKCDLKKKKKAQQAVSNQHSHHGRVDEWTSCTFIDVYVCVLLCLLQCQKNHLPLHSCCQGDLQLYVHLLLCSLLCGIRKNKIGTGVTIQIRYCHLCVFLSMYMTHFWLCLITWAHEISYPASWQSS